MSFSLYLSWNRWRWKPVAWTLYGCRQIGIGWLFAEVQANFGDYA